MLAVTRKVGDKIHINDDIVIHILDLRAKAVRIGVEAPAHYRVFRGELYEKISQTNQEMVQAEFSTEDVKSFLQRAKGLKKGAGGL